MKELKDCLNAATETNGCEGIPTFSGVYIWAWPWDNGHGKKYAAIYVGSAQDVGARIHNEIRDTCNWHSMLVDTPSSKPSELVKYFPYYDFNTTGNPWRSNPAWMQLACDNLKKINIFWAKCANPKDIEGAIQAFLHRFKETRQFIMTGVSSYKHVVHGISTIRITGLGNVIGFNNPQIVTPYSVPIP